MTRYFAIQGTRHGVLWKVTSGGKVWCWTNLTAHRKGWGLSVFTTEGTLPPGAKLITKEEAQALIRKKS